MAPRPGGEADKLGNRYEGIWTIRHALYVLLGQGESITLEPDGVLGEGAEFVYRSNGRTEVHQVKRQNRNANGWSVASLHNKEIWRHLRTHAELGHEFHFVSTVPARPLQELSNQARNSDDYASFVRHRLTKELQPSFNELSSPKIYGTPEMAWRMLRSLWVAWPDERDIIAINATLAEQVLAGASGQVAALGLGDLLNDALGVRLDAAAVTARLPRYRLRRVRLLDGGAVAGAVGEATQRWAASAERDLLQPVIPRPEADLLKERASDGPPLTLLTGAAGGGKSAVLHQAFTGLNTEETPVLAFRLDRLGAFSTTTELGECIGLTTSPVSALGALADGRPSVLIVDQLDAVSVMSGRIPNAFDAVADLVREAGAYPAMRVILACRKFDAEHDHRIRQLTDPERWAHVTIGELDDGQLDSAITAMGLDAAGVGPDQRRQLRSPLHLVLLAQVADREGALAFRTAQQLFDSFWNHKERECRRRNPDARFQEAVSAVAEAISRRQQLSVPHTVLDGNGLSASRDTLVSEHVLVRDGPRIAFFHESFFDYAFARGWMHRNETLVAFLTSSEQELFRRSQVRQILAHLRELDPERFIEETEALLLCQEIRYHIKEATLTLLGSLETPTAEEWDSVARVLETRPAYLDRLVHTIGCASWFGCADADGVIEDWLSGHDSQEREWALRIMAGAVKMYPDRVAELLAPHTTHPDYPLWLLGITRFAEVRDSRPLFDLLLSAVRAGQCAAYERALWVSVHDLGEQRPEWAVELLVAHLSERPDALRLDDHRRVVALRSEDHFVMRLVEHASTGASAFFCDRLVPVLLVVMEATAHPLRAGWPISDGHFAFRWPSQEARGLDSALLNGAATALRASALRSPARLRPLLEELAAVPYDTAQWLLYQALDAAGEALASWSAELLIEGRHRLLAGYSNHVVWSAREVIQSASPSLPGHTLRQLEEAVLHLRLPPKEEFSPWDEFALLSALPEQRLSEQGARRLGELRRRYGGAHQPEVPKEITTGTIAPPIAEEAARKMGDAQWMQAMRKHNEDRTNWDTFTGGALEQCHVLEAQTTEEPKRFARLALTFDREIHPAYGTSLLMGLGKAEELSDPEPVFAAIRHLAGLNLAEHDRWLGQPLQKYLATAPLDLVEIILNRALGAGRPEDEPSELNSPDLYFVGINTVRGGAAESLGDLLLHDSDGSRTALVAPHLHRLAADPSPAVRSCTAHVLLTAMRHTSAQATAAFHVLITADDALLATPRVVRLTVAMGYEDPPAVKPVIQRMLSSADDTVRRSGGLLAALGAMQWDMPDLLQAILAGNDGAQRQGAAELCAQKLSSTADLALAHEALSQFFHDPNQQVREAAATTASALRSRRLRPFRKPLTDLMASPAFSYALPQLLITLEEAPDRVDDLILQCVRRFIEEHGADSADISTRAAADAHHIGEILVRAYTQVGSSSRRSGVLDLLDNLLLNGAQGLTEAVNSVGRP
ncbi:ATP-binding protein [Streptomyces sp. NPDC006798]|uniref:ATP-binding protein n=1 Tax=Streptomyces sp. NPDC006798 TaxID=3155462 RepID=UPI0033E9C70B